MESIRLKPQPSVCLTAIVCTSHLLSAMSVMLTGIDLLLQTALNTVVGASFAWQLYHYVLRAGSGSPVVLSWQADGNWLISTLAGDSYPANRWEILLNVRKMIILRFRHEEKGRVKLILCSDSLAAENLRRLRVRLKTER